MNGSGGENDHGMVDPSVIYIKVDEIPFEFMRRISSTAVRKKPKATNGA